LPVLFAGESRMRYTGARDNGPTARGCARQRGDDCAAHPEAARDSVGHVDLGWHPRSDLGPPRERETEVCVWMCVCERACSAASR
jgi:hypothetical protein